MADGTEAFSIHNGEDHTVDGIAIRKSPMIFLIGLDAIAVDEARVLSVDEFKGRDRGSPTSN
jgi:predicted Zn-dependent protease